MPITDQVATAPCTDPIQVNDSCFWGKACAHYVTHSEKNGSGLESFDASPLELRRRDAAIEIATR